MQSLTATDVGDAAITGTQSGVMVDVVADRLTVALQSLAPVAGVPVAVRVAATDGYGNIDPNYAGTVRFTGSDTDGQYPGPYAFAPADAGVHDSHIVFARAGSQSVTVRDTTLVGRAMVVVTGAMATTIALQTPPQAVAGVPFDVNVIAYDAYGNPAGMYAAVLDFNSTDPNAVLPSAVTAHGNRITAVGPVVLTSAGGQVVQVTDANRGFAAQSTVTVAAATATHLALSGLSSGAAGRLQRLAVQALDAYGNPATGYLGLVAFSSTDPNAQLPMTSAFGSSDAGAKAFANVVLKTVGIQSVTARDVASPAINGSQGNLVIAAAPTAALTVSTAVSSTAGVAQNVVLTAMDAYGNLDANYADAVTLSSSDAGASLPSTQVFSFAPGGQAHTQVTWTTMGNQTLVVQSNGGLTARQANIHVTAAALAKFLVTGIAPGLAGRSNFVNLQATDDFNNLVGNYQGTVAFTSSDLAANLPGLTTFNASNGGRRILPITLSTAGLQSVRVTDVNQTSLTGAQTGIFVGVAATHFQVVAPVSLAAGAPFTLSISAMDDHNNIDPNYNGTLVLSSTSRQTSLPTQVVIGPGMGGTISLPNVALQGAGTGLVITARDANAQLTGTCARSPWCRGPP